MEDSRNSIDKKIIIVGILAQETTGIRLNHPDVTFQCYISSAYVEFAKSMGAKIIPILIEKEENYYKDVLKKVNGVIFPGGATYFNNPNETNGYANAGRHIFNIVKNMNDNGIYIPIFGICLGMQLIIWISTDIDREECEKTYKMEQLFFTKDYRNSKMFCDAIEDDMEIFMKNVCEFHHRWCYTVESLKSNDDWKIISYKEEIISDNEKKMIVTSLESKRYPFYGFQFHPEKPEFELNSKCPSEIKQLAEKANRYFLTFFKKELEKSNNRRDLYLNDSLLINDKNLYETSHWLPCSSQCYMY